VLDPGHDDRIPACAENPVVGFRRARREDDLGGLGTNESRHLSRARSTIARARRPSAWTDDGLPTCSMAASIAAFASGRSGAVALWSK
jgi:hypothetical protein